MLHYAFLVLPDFSNLCLINSVEVLKAANDLSSETIYEVTVASMEGDTVASYSGFSAPVECSLGELLEKNPPDLLFVLASYNYQRHCTANVLAELRRASFLVPRLAGLDGGSYALAKAGLLDGYRATIHWTEAELFRESFPNVDVCHDRYVTDRNRITSGGSVSTLDLIFNLIRQDCGNSLALALSELLIFDTERPGNTKQKQNLPWQLEEKSPRVSKAIKIMEKHIESPLSIECLAKFIGISQRQLERDFKEILNTTVAKHYASIRITATRRLVRETKLSVTEIAVRCGFNSIASLIRVYRQKYDCTPTEDRKRQCVKPRV